MALWSRIEIIGAFGNVQRPTLITDMAQNCLKLPSTYPTSILDACGDTNAALRGDEVDFTKTRCAYFACQV